LPRCAQRPFAAMTSLVLSILAPVVLVASTPDAAAAASGAAPADGSGVKKLHRVRGGPYFNNPHGTKKAKFRIERQVINAIRSTPRKGYIRIALYSFDRMPVAKALLDARRRGVHVQLLLNDHQDTRAMKVLRAKLGTNRWGRDFIYKCKSSCRGTTPDRNLHSKFYTFTRSGRSAHVLMVGSANMMLNADIHQWNDLFVTSGRRRIFDQYVALFNDMKHDYSRNQPSYMFCGRPSGAHCDDAVDKMTTRVFPRHSNKKHDVVLSMLHRVRCLTPRPDGSQKRTQLLLSMHTIRGQRGNYIASAIRQKWAEGCAFRVNYGLIGYHTKQILGAATSRGRIPLRSTGFDFNGDGEVDRYSHQKYFVIRGNYAGHPHEAITVTGSSNWASLGTAQDEVFVTLRGSGIAKKYVKNFNFEWRPGNSRPGYTTTFESYRVARQVRTSDGGVRRLNTTVRRPVTTVEPDGLRPPGGTWNDD
jgi:phosphatidylserine/phosphatidylglycerophosphate/cardiolipin synthase-like enzyme